MATSWRARIFRKSWTFHILMPQVGCSWQLCQQICDVVSVTCRVHAVLLCADCFVVPIRMTAIMHGWAG
jgi:hypothetical protein